MQSQPYPLVSLSVTDRFADGHGGLSVKLWSFIPVANARGPEMDQGELQRYLSEMAYYPTAWLSHAIEWQAVDAYTAKATMRSQGITASTDLHVNEEGKLTHVTTERYMAEHGHYQLEAWSGRFDEYREVGGMLIPAKFAVIWHLASGEFNWLRGELTAIEYN